MSMLWLHGNGWTRTYSLTDSRNNEDSAYTSFFFLAAGRPTSTVQMLYSL